MDQQATFAAVIALSAACAFAVSNALQHRAASGVPRGVSKVGRVLLHLARNPWWLTGTMLSFVGMLLHATALRWGSLAFVQPLLLVGLVLAIPVRAALERKLPLSRELRAVAITAVGLATYLSSVTLAPGEASSPEGGRDHDDGRSGSCSPWPLSPPAAGGSGDATGCMPACWAPPRDASSGSPRGC